MTCCWKQKEQFFAKSNLFSLIVLVVHTLKTRENKNYHRQSLFETCFCKLLVNFQSCPMMTVGWDRPLQRRHLLSAKFKVWKSGFFSWLQKLSTEWTCISLAPGGCRSPHPHSYELCACCSGMIQIDLGASAMAAISVRCKTTKRPLLFLLLFNLLVLKEAS